MKASRNDPRSQRTRHALRTAVMELVPASSASNLTVTTITRQAGLHRSTFYLHYDGPVDLYRDCMRALFEELRREVWTLRPATDHPRADRWTPHVARVFRHLSDHEPFYRSILGRPGAPVFRALFQDALHDLMLEPILTQNPAPPTGARFEMTLRFFIGGFTEVASWWLENGQPLAIQQAATQVVRDTLPDYLRLLGDQPGAPA